MARTKQTYRRVRPGERVTLPTCVTIPLNKSFTAACIVKMNGASSVKQRFKDFMNSPLASHNAAILREYISNKVALGKALNKFEARFVVADQSNTLSQHNATHFTGNMKYSGCVISGWTSRVRVKK